MGGISVFLYQLGSTQWQHIQTNESLGTVLVLDWRQVFLIVEDTSHFLVSMVANHYFMRMRIIHIQSLSCDWTLYCKESMYPPSLESIEINFGCNCVSNKRKIGVALDSPQWNLYICDHRSFWEVRQLDTCTKSTKLEQVELCKYDALATSRAFV